MSDNQTSSSGSNAPFSGDDTEQEVVKFSTRSDADGASSATVALTPADDCRSKEVHCDPRPIVPVIFLPGVMGTLLANKKTGDEAFFAPNLDQFGSSIGGLFSVIAGWFRSASAREKRFDPLEVAVTPLGPINVGDGNTISEDEARRRGWGSVHRWSYHPILLWLEENLNKPMLENKPHGVWIDPDKDGKDWALHPLLGTPPQTYGAYGPEEQAIDPASPEFLNFASFRYRVYAIGYNWLQSNDLSGRDVVAGLTYSDPQTKQSTRLMGITEICEENHTGKAIVLTHSMGGLVARFAVVNYGAGGMMHGVFHSAQPATGAPLAAKRYRTGGGSEGGMDGFVNGSLLGRDADEFIAVMANAPGPMELLPMPDYINGEAWWKFSRADGEVKLKLPQEGDAYNELYLNSQWYGLLPNESQLDPSGTVKSRLADQDKTATVLSHYKVTLQDVVTHQSQLKNHYHGKTYVAYGNGELTAKSQTGGSESSGSDGATAPKIEKGGKAEQLGTWGTVIWTADQLPSDVTESELRAAKLLHDSGSGEIRVYLERTGQSVTFTAQKTKKPSTSHRDSGIIPGDGTVPSWSADAQARGLKPDVKGDKAEGVQMAFVQGGYEHQFSYAHPWTRWALLYSLVEMMKKVPVPGET